MNKQDLVETVALKAGTTKKEAEKVVGTVFDVIEGALTRGEKVQIVGFGTFEVRDRAARTGRNPQTGVEIEIAATRVPAFSPGKGLKEVVAG